MNADNRRRGFTLIEILIVVVIMGILAALVIPRFMNGPEKAIVGEANQMIGALIRAEQANSDLGIAFVAITDNTSASDWNRLGMTPPATSGANKFNYTCVAGTSTCTATRVTNNANTVSLTMGNMTWTCAGEYRGMTNGGCTLG